MSIGLHGKISFLWILPDCRGTGLARGLLSWAIRELEPKRLFISFHYN
ncbi:MAG: GNAT family N-acetyltransferase, partial [Clostridiaceae bacterium]|nr:GNAT family N-acetyltransferase [Clostridiaceae bacterium]